MISVTKTIGNTDYNYKIITAGAKFALQQGMPVKIYYNGQPYWGKMHSKTVGRIDGLSALYKVTGLQVGDEITLTYKAGTDIIYMEIIGQEYELKFAEDDFDVDIQMEQGYTADSKLKRIQDSLEPVAVHWEYYHKREFPRNVTINGSWILYEQGRSTYLLEENSQEKIELNLNREKTGYLLGMNRVGVWYAMVADIPTWDGGEWFSEIACINLADNTQRRISCNPERASVDGEFYIYDNNVYYIARVSERCQKLMRVDFTSGREYVIYASYEREEISCISADATRVTYRLKYDGEVRWIVQEIVTQECMELETNSNSNCSWEPLVEIYMVDLEKNVFWTGLTEAECIKWDVEKIDLIARPLADPKEGTVCVNKSSHAPIIYRSSIELDGMDWYFDGEDMYIGEYCTPLLRIDDESVRYRVGDPRIHLHGDAQRFIVSDSYVYVDYDGYGPVRLPRKFFTSMEDGINNPEARKIAFTLL